MGPAVSEKKFYPEINIARGLALLFVTLGHSFPKYSVGDDPNIAEAFIVNYVYYFHMALFMFLAGFVASRKLYSPHINFLVEVTKNAKRLLIPYFLYSIISFFLKLALNAYAKNPFYASDWWRIFLGDSPHGGLWYVWTLFVLSLCVLAISRLVRNDIVFLLLGILLQILFFTLPMDIFAPLSRMAVFYLAGAVFARHYDVVAKKYTTHTKRRYVSVLLPAAALLVIGLVNLAYIGKGVQENLYPLTAAMGIYASLAISLKIIERPGRGQRILKELGDYSYDLYLLSYFVQIPIRVVGYSMLKLPYAIVVFSLVTLGILIPYVASRFVIRRFRLLSGIMLGRWDSTSGIRVPELNLVSGKR